LDPRDPLNAVIVNLDKTPRNPAGLVEFSSPFFILKPADMTSSNHKIFFGFNNRPASASACTPTPLITFMRDEK